MEALINKKDGDDFKFALKSPTLAVDLPKKLVISKKTYGDPVRNK